MMNLSAKELVAAIVLTIGLFVPGFASAHDRLTQEEIAGLGRIHGPEAPLNIRVEGVSDRSHNTIEISWDEPHNHNDFGNEFSNHHAVSYYLSVYTAPFPRIIQQAHTTDRAVICALRYDAARPGVELPLPPGCTRKVIPFDQDSYSETISGLSPETTYYVIIMAIPISADWNRAYSYHYQGAIGRITTSEIPCTYTSTLVEVPSDSRIVVSSRESNATATIRAYRDNNGQSIDVLDSSNRRISNPVSLAPANSIKRFRIEDISGWHTVIVEHGTARLAYRTTVGMRVRQTDGSYFMEYARGVEDCTQ